VLLIDIAHRRRRGRGREPGELLVEISPDLALIGVAVPPALQRVRDLGHLPGAAFGVMGMRSGSEFLRPVMPATPLDTGNRNDESLARGDKNAQVENTVLLGSDQLLAVEEEDRLAGFVDKLEVRNAPTFRNLCDVGRFHCQGFVQRQVVGLLPLAVRKREESQIAERYGRSDFEVRNRIGNDFHAASYEPASKGRASHPPRPVNPGLWCNDYIMIPGSDTRGHTICGGCRTRCLSKHRAGTLCAPEAFMFGISGQRQPVDQPQDQATCVNSNGLALTRNHMNRYVLKCL